jgi:hypothetical protein
MCAWCQSLGAIATIIAATVAAGITFYFGRVQANIGKQQATTASLQAGIANQQAQTALDRLRYDLFDKRYAIYLATKDLLRYVVNNAASGEIEAATVVSFFLTIDEAPFFFPPDFCQFLGDIQDECRKVAEISSARNPDNPDWVIQSCDLSRPETNLANLLQGLPSHFARVLTFQQLTRPSSPT